MTGLLFQDIPAGATISDIEPLASDPNIRRIKVDGKVAARLRAGDVAALDLAVGQAWTDTLARAVKSALATNKARKAALSILGRRGYARAELLERLVRKGHDRTSARLVADEMVADGWIDEEEYARSIARGILSRKPAGHRLLIQKMLTRRIEPELAERIAQEALRDVDLTEAAAALARRRLETMTGLPPAAVRRRLSGLLARRGFDREVIQAAISGLEIVFDGDPPVD
ncbi:MAG: regulatory protein RecX [Phycisphaerales bacterium]|nr:MAG: regulatory protein RecX [Phycisphaerales bacterium]